MADDVLLQIAATDMVLRPGDVLVLATERSLSMAEAARVAEHFTAQCPDLRVVIADGFSGLAAYRPDDAQSEGSAVGPCSAVLRTVFDGGVSTWCQLRHGHSGDHKDGPTRWKEAPEDRPEMLSDRLGYPGTVGDEDWRRINGMRPSGGDQ